MAVNSAQLDAIALDSLTIPYNPFAKKLDSEVRFIAGSNVYVSLNKTVRKRGGQSGTDITGKTVTGRIDRSGVYKTLENPAKVYLVASIYNGSGWEMRYLRLDAGGSPAWTLMTDLRSMNSSEQPHEFVIARGLLFIKSFPNVVFNALGTTIFRGSDVTTQYWGIEAPTVPARRSGATSTWTTIAGNTVRVGWKYVYTWKDVLGHESNRSDLEFNPANQPSDTGAFSNKKPNMVVQGHADTARITTIVVYRTSDGGGSFRKLEEITNTGAGSINYLDDNLNGTLAIPDDKLDVRDVAPSLTSNSVPPANIAPAVTGTDAIEQSTKLVYWQGRIWYAIGNFLFFSGQEEIRKGMPESCFPSGFFGNFFPFQSRITQLIPTTDLLYIVTTSGSLAIEGRFRDEFSFRTVSEFIGGAEFQSSACTSIGDTVFWLTHDFQIAIGQGANARIISTELNTDLTSLANTSAYRFELVPYIAVGRLWLIVFTHNTSDPTLSKYWIFDLVMKLWSPAQSGSRLTAACYGQPRETDKIPKLIMSLWNGGSPGTSLAAYYDESTYQDLVPGSSAVGISFTFDTNLWSIPTGNNLNAVRAASHTANFAGFRLQWSGESAGLAPTVSFALDSTDDADLATITGVEPTLQANDGGYTTKDYPVEQMAQRARMRVARTADTDEFVLETIAALWQTDMGA